MKGQKRVALIELRNYHDEVLPSVARAFLDTGCNVDVFLTAVNRRKMAFHYVPRSAELRFFSLSMATRLLFDLGQFNSYSIVVLNTVEGISLARYAKKIGSPLMLGLHNASAAFEKPIEEIRTRRNARCLVFAPHVAQCLQEKNVDSACVLPVYFGNVPEASRSRHAFVVQGNFVPQKRNYADLLDTVLQLKEKLPKDFMVRLVGRSGSVEARSFRELIRQSGMEERFSFSNRRAISFPRFYRELRSATFILPLIDRSSDDFKEYYESTLSSSVSMGLGLGLIPIMEESYAEKYGMSGFAITYRTGELASALEKALAMDDLELEDRRADLTNHWKEAVEAAAREIERCCSGLEKASQRGRGLYNALLGLNLILLILFCALVGWLFHFNAMAIAIAAFVGWLGTRFVYDLKDIWLYNIKRPLARVKNQMVSLHAKRR